MAEGGTASATAAGVVQGAAITATGVALGYAVGRPIGAAILGVVSLLFAIPYGRAITISRCYRGAGGFFLCVVDATWSTLNTWAGAIYYGIHRLTGNTLEVARSQGTGALWLTKGVVSKYATTIGIVKAGSSPSIDEHESLHIFQARLFGPLYIPLVVLNYVVATIIPYWLLFYDKSRYPVSGFFTYFEHGVYPHVWNELWAYRATEA